MTDLPETHRVLTVRHQLREVADAYEALAERALNGPDPNVLRDQIRGTEPELDPNAPGPDGKPIGEVTGTLVSAPAPAWLPAVDARRKIDQWATWLARAVMDARDASGRPWGPRSHDSAAILREIADEHLGVFLGSNGLEVGEFMDECAEWVGWARRNTLGLEARWLRLHVPCAEMADSPDGARVPCEGEYRMRMRSKQDALADMVCDRDQTHRITPVEWMRAMRRASNPASAARSVVNIRLLTKEGA